METDQRRRYRQTAAEPDDTPEISTDGPDDAPADDDRDWLIEEVRTTVRELFNAVATVRVFPDGTTDSGQAMIQIASHVGYLRGLLSEPD